MKSRPLTTIVPTTACNHVIHWSQFSSGLTHCYICHPPKPLKKPKRIGLLVAPGKILSCEDICDDIENAHQKVREHRAQAILALAGFDQDDFKAIRGVDIFFPSAHHKYMQLCGVSFGDRPLTQIYDRSTIANPDGKTWASVSGEVARKSKQAFERKQREEEQAKSTKPKRGRRQPAGTTRRRGP